MTPPREPSSAPEAPEADGSWDVVVVGSGFGGSVAALRLVEKGYRVLLLEKGRRYGPSDFPRTNWNLPRWLWAPRLGLRGPFRMTFLRHVTALSGVGVGGGSLVYANTLADAGEGFYAAPGWAGLADWRAELEPHYATARRMLGATRQPHRTPPDEIVGDLAREMGMEERHRSVDVGVWFGEPGERVRDPFFGGEGPDVVGCVQCGGCMLGCRHEAKNTLDRNYLWLAEARGLEIRPEHEVTAVRPVGREDGSDGYEVEALVGPSRWWRPRRRRTFRAGKVVLAGGVLGTVPLLLRLREDPRGLPRLSPRVGDVVRTNSEVLVGVVSGERERAMSEGVAITSILHTDDRSTLEPVRYPDGSGFFRLLMMPHAPGASLPARVLGAMARVLRDPWGALRAVTVPDLSRHTLILLYMRTEDAHLSIRPGAGPLPLRTRVTRGDAPTASLPEATEIAERVARRLNGFPMSLATETLLGSPTTAHLLGGAVVSRSPEEGVVDADHRVWGYRNLWVVDGSALPANPGVNPSLTITAMAERAMAAVPPAGL